jgi:hypothetical protein
MKALIFVGERAAAFALKGSKEPRQPTFALRLMPKWRGDLPTAPGVRIIQSPHLQLPAGAGSPPQEVGLNCDRHTMSGSRVANGICDDWPLRSVAIGGRLGVRYGRRERVLFHADFADN